MPLQSRFSRLKHRIVAGPHESQDVENQIVSCQFPVVPQFSQGLSVVFSLPADGGVDAGLRPGVCGWRVSQNVV